MTDTRPKSGLPTRTATYRTWWRWHFYAGIMVLPFLLLLSLTGGIYLFKDQIETALYRPMAEVPVTAPTATPDDWLASANRSLEGQITHVTLPRPEGQAVQIRIKTPDGQSRIVFINPYNAAVTGTAPYEGVTEFVRKLHSLSLFGGPAGQALNLVIEIVAGWAIILSVTGLYLWWPRNRLGAVFRLKEKDARRRPFWRDLHAVTGLYAAAIILFLAVTGMPWSAVWGDQFMGLMRVTQLGRPEAPAALTRVSTGDFSHHDGLGWTMGGTAALNPATGSPVHESPSLQQVIAAAEAADLKRPYLITLPARPDQAITAAVQSPKVEDTRILYIDRTTGQSLGDVRWDRFGPMAKGFEWGIFVHQGHQYGWTNRLIMLGGCIALWVLAISGLVMWWKRRPPRLSPPRLNAPPALAPRRFGPLLGLVLGLCLLFPLTGLSLMVVVLFDRVIGRRLFSPSRPQA